MLSFIARLLRGEQLPEPILTPPGFPGPVVPAVDDVESTDDSPTSRVGKSDLAPLNRALVIEYEDAAGEPSTRRINLKEIFGSRGRIYLECYCLERQAPRRFRADRVIDVYCGVTGEDIGPPERLFQPRYTDDDAFARARKPSPPKILVQESDDLRRMRAALRVLMTIARSDGRVHPGEEKVVGDFISLHWRGDENGDGLMMEALCLAPSFEGFLDSCNAVFAEADDLAVAVIQVAGPLCMADGDVTDREISLLEDISMIARAYGLPVEMEITGAR